MPAVSVKTLEVEVFRGRQDVIYKELLQFGEHKLRVEIRSDAYKFQCYARISILQKAEGVKWEVLDYIHHGGMKTEEGLCYRAPGNPLSAKTAFKVDRDALVSKAKVLLA